MATPPIPMANPNRLVDTEMRFEDPQFPQLASEERYNNLIKETLNVISTNEGTNNFDLVKTKKAKEIIKTPYDMVGYFGRYLVPEKSPTKMTIREVIDFGRKLVNATQNKKDSKGKKLQPTSAMGKYQIMSNSFGVGATKVLEEFSNKLGLDIDTQLFTAEIQDKLAIKMIEERVPSLKDFSMSETDKNINKVIDELNGTWRGISNSEGKTSKGQNVGKLSFEEIKNKLINTKQNPGEYGVGSDKDDTERMLTNERIDEQEIDSKPINPESLENQREKQRKTTKEQSGFNLIRPAEGADLQSIEANADKIMNKPLNDIADEDTVTTENLPPLDQGDDVSVAPMPKENAASDYEKVFNKYDTELPEEEEDSISYSKGIGEEDTVIDREGMDYDDTPEIQMSEDDGIGEFLSNLFTSSNLMADETDMFDDQEYQNLHGGGEVEADFVDDDKEEDETDPPPGATPEQVADDIPAMLSEGEYVLPANVVNFLGVKNIAEMHQSVLDEIQQMSDLGFVENVDANGEPEEDDDEMPTVAKDGSVETQEDKKGTATLIIASASPKGMMCPEPMMFNGGGQAELDIGAGSGGGGSGYDSDATFGVDGYDADYSGMTDLSKESANPEFDADYSDLGFQQEAKDYPGGFEVEGRGLTQKELDEDMAKFEKDLKNTDFRTVARKMAMPVLSLLGKDRVDAAGVAHGAFTEFGNKRQQAAAAEYDKEFLGTDKWNLEDKRQAMFDTFSALGGSKQEEDTFYGGAEAMQEGMDTPGGLSEGRQFGDGYISDAELDAAMGSNTASKDSSPKKQFIPGVGYVRDGGLMAKGYNEGGMSDPSGGFVPDVGLVPITEGMRFNTSPTTNFLDYKDVLKKTRGNDSNIFGFDSWDNAAKFYKANPYLKDQDMINRKNDARYIVNSKFSGIEGSNLYHQDAYLDNKLRSYNVDSDDFADVMDRFKDGYVDLNPLISTAANLRLANDLTAYANEKRVKRFGFTPNDAGQLPEESTNLDALKSIFRTEINYQDDALDQENADIAGTRNPTGMQRAYSPGSYRTFKENVLNEGKIKPEYREFLKLDEPMNLETVNRASLFLNTGGDPQYIDPNNAKYSEDIFQKFDHLQNLSPTASKGLLSPRTDLGEFVSGVGYV